MQPPVIFVSSLIINMQHWGLSSMVASERRRESGHWDASSKSHIYDIRERRLRVVSGHSRTSAFGHKRSFACCYALTKSDSRSRGKSGYVCSDMPIINALPSDASQSPTTIDRRFVRRCASRKPTKQSNRQRIRGSKKPEHMTQRESKGRRPKGHSKGL